MDAHLLVYLYAYIYGFSQFLQKAKQVRDVPNLLIVILKYFNRSTV